MNIYTLLTSISEAVADNANIKTWAQTNYTKDHYVFINFDVRNPPEENNCPFVAIYPIHKSVGNTKAVQSHSFEIVCCISQTATATRSKTNLLEYTGFGELEEFRKLVETVIAGVNISNSDLSEINIEYEAIEMFPLFMCGMTVTITNHVTIGSDYLS